eukprot:11180686-Lingulodinium_polyedra.AAC.1
MGWPAILATPTAAPSTTLPPRPPPAQGACTRVAPATQNLILVGRAQNAPMPENTRDWGRETARRAQRGPG